MSIMTFGLGASRSQGLSTACTPYTVHNPHLVEIVRASDMSETAVADPTSFDSFDLEQMEGPMCEFHSARIIHVHFLGC